MERRKIAKADRSTDPRFELAFDRIEKLLVVMETPVIPLKAEDRL